MKKNFTLTILLLGGILMGGCMKPKEDSKIPFLDVTGTSSSGIRLFNFASGAVDGADVTINNVPLTSYGATSSGTVSGTTLGLSLFPTGVWKSGDNGNPFSVPNSLLDKDGKAHIVLSSITSVYGAGVPFLDTVITNDVVHPKDYYLLTDQHLKILDRDNVPPTRAGYFKLRIINLGTANADNAALGIAGPVSLTHADGTEVDPLLNNVAMGTNSPYVELPYNSYQFKLFLSNGATIDVNKQLAEEPLQPYYNPCMVSDNIQQGITPQVRTYKAGGVYSIVITENYYRKFSCDQQAAGRFLNGYRVVTELNPGTNYIYASLQAVNAMPGKQVTIQIDGKPLGGQLAYIGETFITKAVQPPGDIFIRGNHHVQVIDGSGQVLASKDLTLYPADHYTIWAYEQPDGKPGILFEANDMTGSIYASSFRPDGINEAPDDGTNGSVRKRKYPYSWESRFLNLTPDLPYATFTNNQQLFLPAIFGLADTLRYPSAYVNLAAGMQPLQNASLMYSLPFISPYQADNNATGNPEDGFFPSQVRVFQSKPGPMPEVPGTVLPEVMPLNMKQASIANEQLYTDDRFKRPETGVYTVAVVGRMSKAASTTEKARIIVIKHNN